MENQYRNTQGELISIKQMGSGEFAGQHVLCIHDDPEVSDTVAYHLLDIGTLNWLLEMLTTTIPLNKKVQATS